MRRIDMKKLIAVILILVIVISMTGCKGASESGLGKDRKDFKVDWEGPVKENLPRYKIGLVYAQFTDKLGSQMQNAMKYLADAFNVEFSYIESGGDAEQTLKIMESAAQTGLDGVLMVGGTPAILDALGDIPLVTIQAEPTNDEVAAEMSTYDNYLGAVCENDYDVGYRAAEALYKQGARKFGLLGLTKGLSKTHDQRAKAFVDFVSKQEDAELLAEDYSLAKLAEGITAFAASFPEMDGLFSTLGMESAYQAMRTEGLTGKVKFATIDISESTGDYFESGDLAWIAGGQYGTTMVGFAILYNYIADGTRIIPDTKETFYRPFLEISSLKEFETYVKYVDSEIPVYSIGEVANMIHAFNEDADFEYFQKLAEDYSMEDIKTRHAELFDE
jgi:ABC-type sugar transport system substrate-binding protein